MSRLIATGVLLAAWAAVFVTVFSVVSAEGRPAPRSEPARDSTPERGAREREVSIAWAGDVTPGSRYGNPPAGGRALFASVRAPLRRPDLTLGNLEGTLSVGGASKCGGDGGRCFSFQAPPGHAGAFRWAGFDLVNLANNHAFDFGAGGQRQTVAALERHGLGHTGRPGQITVVGRQGIRVATVGFAPYRWASELRDRAGVRRLVAAAAERAELVVVMAHAGGEGSDHTRVPLGREIAMGEDRGDTRAFAHAAVDAGADLVLGSGPHVLRGIELYRGKLIAYSLGNFAGWRNFSTARSLSLSGLLTVRLSSEGELRGGRFRALRLEGPGVPVPDRAGTAVALVDRLGRADFGRAGLRLLEDGSF